MLMSSDDGDVDHRVFVVRIVSQRLEKTLPHAALRPPREPRVNVLPVAEALGQIPPRRPRAEFPNHRLNEKSIAQFAIASLEASVLPPPLDNSPPQRDESPLVCPNPPTRCLEGSKTTPVPAGLNATSGQDFGPWRKE